MDNNFEITPEILKKILSEKSMKMYVHEIEEMMDEEVQKPVEEMDTELVDICASALCDYYGVQFKERPMYKPWEEEAKQKRKKKIITFKKLLYIAAAAAVLTVVALPAGAKLVPGEISNSIIEFYSDHFKLDFLKDKPAVITDNWLHTLISDNLNQLILPQAILDEEYDKNYQIDDSGEITVIYIKLSNSDEQVEGNAIISQYTNKEDAKINGDINVSGMYKNFKHITKNDLDIFVFGEDNQIYINYVKDATGYEFILNCSFEKAIEIAETI